jgi:sarcosine oxidase subunit gamma
VEQSNIFKVSPLIGHADVPSQIGVDGRSGVIFGELAFCVHLNLRCDPSDSQTLAAASAALGVDLPLVPNTFYEASDIRIHWLGPDEWLVLAPMTHIYLFEKINSAWTGFHHSVTDITGGQTVVRIEGERVREVLNQGCTLDLHQRAFQVGQCAQSLLAHVPVLISRNSDNGNAICRFDLVVRRSYADHLVRWLVDAAREIGFVSRLGDSNPSTSLNNSS